MNTAIGVGIFVAFILTGVYAILWPADMYARRRDPGDPELPTSRDLRRTRVEGAIIVLMGCAGVYAILTNDGTPVGPVF